MKVQNRFEIAKEYSYELDDCIENINDTGGIANPEHYPHMFEEKFISVDCLGEIRQLSCLESWCKSRGKGDDYCANCKTIIKLGGRKK